MASHHGYGSELSTLIATPASSNRNKIKRIVITGCFINALLMCMKLLVGYLGHSDALVADGYHSLNDFAADLIMLLFIGISFKKADSRYSYGYGKFETFSSFLISVFLLFIGVHIAFEAVESIEAYSGGSILPQPDIWTVVIVIVSMCAKEFLFRYYRKGSQDTGTAALLTNAWHHRSDALASVATLIGVTFAHFLGVKWRILDPCASLILVVFIIVAAVRMLIPAFTELMDKSTPAFISEKAESIVENTQGVVTLISSRTRKNGHTLIFDFTIGIHPNLTVKEAEVIVSRIEDKLKAGFGPSLMLSISTKPSE